MAFDEVTIGNCRLIHGDCLEILPHLPKFDLILTDPPFGMGNFVQTSGNVRGRGEGFGTKVIWNDETPSKEVFDLIRQKSKERVIWGANFFNCFEEGGGAIVWVKQQPMPNFSKADIASCTHFKKTEIVTIPWTNFYAARQSESDHPCERPVLLYEWCLEYMPKSKNVCDPFMGSGTTGVACARMGLQFTGIERERKYFEIACRRIEQAYSQPRLFQEENPTPENTTLFD